MAKSARDKIRLNSSAGTGHFYTTDKNKKNTPGKMEIKKYDPSCASTSCTKKAKSSNRCASNTWKNPPSRRVFFA